LCIDWSSASAKAQSASAARGAASWRWHWARLARHATIGDRASFNYRGRTSTGEEDQREEMAHQHAA